MTNRRAAGFTLLEILVALVVLGFLLVALGQGSRFGTRALNVQTRMIDQREGLEAVDRALRRMIEQADAGTPGGEAPVTGTPSRLAFTTRLPVATVEGQYADTVLAVDGARRLVLRWTPHRHAVRFGPPPGPEEVELLRGVARLEIGYWRRSGEGGWLGSWSDREPPALIRVRIVFAEGDPRRWPDIVVAPMNGRPGE